VVGATSGIGRELAKELSRRGYAVGISGRREELLRSLREELAGPSASVVMDVTEPEEAVCGLEELAGELNGMDLLVVSSGIGVPNPDMEWEPERQTLDVNVMGFTALITAGYRYFARQGHGHLVGISSVAGERGMRHNVAYSASKAFNMAYLEGLRGRARHDGIRVAVTDIRPGFVATPMTEGHEGMFWVISAEVAARQIADVIKRRKRVAYIPYRWSVLAWVARRAPGWVWERL